MIWTTRIPRPNAARAGVLCFVVGGMLLAALAGVQGFRPPDIIFDAHVGTGWARAPRAHAQGPGELLEAV